MDQGLATHADAAQKTRWTSWHCRLHPAQEESFCSVELRRYPCSNLQVKVSNSCP